MLIGSLTAYAAAEYAQIHDSNGRTVIEAVAETPIYPLPKDIAEQFDAYRQRVLKQLKQGQMLAYYINDDKLNSNGYDMANPIKFEFNLLYSSYEDYVQKLRQVSGPRLEMPDYLPEGYVFKHGQISPRPPMRGDKDHSAYDKLQKKLLERAAALKGTDKLVVEPVDWTNTLGVNLGFTNGSTVLNLMAQIGPDNPQYGGKATVAQSPSATSETVRIGEQEVLYRSDDSQGADIPHYLLWYDEQKNVYYTIMDSTGSELTRKDFIRIAQSMMKQAGE
jgi:hypothetical protein